MGLPRLAAILLPLCFLLGGAAVSDQLRWQVDGAVSVAEVTAGFETPPDFHRPAMFWAWNADPTPELIREQLREMRRAGLGGVVIMPMPADFRPGDFIDGMHIPYLSDDFFRAMRLAAEGCRALGLKMWIYDEGGWPSGIAHGLVTEGHPEFRGKVLKREGSGFTVAFEGYPTDLLDRDAVRRFLEVTHERYRHWVGDLFGDTIVGVFTDEMRVGGRVGSDAIPWTERLPDEFEAQKGYPIEQSLPLLFSGAPEEPRTEQARCDFWDVWSRLFEEAYFKQTADWCEANGLLFTGHMGGEDELLGEHWGGFGHFFRVMRPIHVPAVDAIWRQIFPGGPPSDFPKLAGSAAHHAGKRYTLTESFAVYGWGLTPAQMKWITDQQFVRGINLMQPMMVCLKEDEYGLANTASDLGPANPLWQHFNFWADYAGRLSWMLAQGAPEVRVALYLPVASRWAGCEVSESVTAIADHLLRHQIDFDFVDDDCIARAGAAGGVLSVGPMPYRAVVVPAAPVMRASTLERLARFCEGGGLLVLVDELPSRPCERGAEARFAAARERVSWERRPEAQAGKALGEGKVVFLPRAQRESVADVLGQAVARDFVLLKPNANIRYCHRRLSDADLYFVTNESDKRQRLRVRLEGEGAAVRWEPETGRRIRLRARGGWVTLSLEGYGSALLTVGAEPPGALPASRPWRRALKIEGPWALRAQERHVIETDGRVTMSTEAGEWAAARLGDWRRALGQYFSGTAEYRYEFEAPEAALKAEAAINLGRVRYVACVRVNGRETSPAHVGWQPYRVEATGLLKPGRNLLEIEVTNTLADQSLRPEVVEMMQAKGWRNGYRRRAEAFEAESLGGGLFGPVTLEIR